MRSPLGVLCKCRPETSLGTGEHLVTPDSEPFQHTTVRALLWGGHTGLPWPFVLEETLSTVIRHSQAASEWTWDQPAPALTISTFHKRTWVPGQLEAENRLTYRYFLHLANMYRAPATCPVRSWALKIQDVIQDVQETQSILEHLAVTSGKGAGHNTK